MSSTTYQAGRIGKIVFAGLLLWYAFGNHARSSEPAAGTPMRIELGNNVHLEMVWIPAGAFVLKDEKHVSFSEGFWLGKYPVTQGQYQQMMGNNPSYFVAVGPDAPVERVTWFDAKAFCEKLKEHLPARLHGGLVRLPTNAEWEYACQAGTTTDMYTGRDLSSRRVKTCEFLDEIAWYAGNSEGRTHPVGQKKPNAWGLYDMRGNVREWTEDSDYRLIDEPRDPIGAGSGQRRGMRGGAWRETPVETLEKSIGGHNGANAVYFSVELPDRYGADVGFRVLARPPLPPGAAPRKEITLSQQCPSLHDQTSRESVYERAARETFQKKMDELPRIEGHTVIQDGMFSRIDLSGTFEEIENKRHFAFVFRTPEDVATRWAGLFIVPPHGGTRLEYGMPSVGHLHLGRSTSAIQAKVWIAPADGNILQGGRVRSDRLDFEVENAGAIHDFYMIYSVDGRYLKPLTDYVAWIFLDYGLKPIVSVSLYMPTVIEIKQHWGFIRYPDTRNENIRSKSIKQARKAVRLMERGINHMSKAEYERADELLTSSLELTREIYGEDNFRIPLLLLRLAQCNIQLGREDKALFFAKTALAIQNKMHEPDYIGIGVSLSHIANVLQIRKQYAEADALYKQLLPIYEKNLGRNNPLTIEHHVRYMYMLQQAGSPSEAERASKQLLAYGSNPHATVSALNMYFDNFAQEEKYAEAERAFKLLLTNAAGHRETLVMLKLCAEAMHRQEKHAEAAPLLQRALAMQEKRFGSQHAELADTLIFLAIIHYEMDMPAQSEILLRRVRAIADSRIAAIGARHVGTVSSEVDFSKNKQGTRYEVKTHFVPAPALRDPKGDLELNDLILTLERLIGMSRFDNDPEAAARYEKRLNAIRDPTRLNH